MAYQSSAIDPQFSRIGGQSFSDADFIAFAGASEKVQAASLRIHDFSMGTDFDALATRLHDRSKDLGDAAAAKDAAKINTALEAMRQACKDCHHAFR
jgi:cytochrome c556